MQTNIRNWLRPVELGAVAVKPTHGEIQRLTRGSAINGVDDWLWGLHQRDREWDW